MENTGGIETAQSELFCSMSLRRRLISLRRITTVVVSASTLCLSLWILLLVDSVMILHRDLCWTNLLKETSLSGWLLRDEKR